MRRFRRRRARPIWFPPLGTQIAQTGIFTGGTTIDVPVLGSGAFFNGFLPLTFDQGQEQEINVANVTLSDLLNSSWRLRRMIGYIYGTYTVTGLGAGDPQANQPVAALFGVGAMVCSVDATGSPTKTTINPLEQDDYTDPWIFRRVWILGQGQHLTREGAGLSVLAGFRASAGAVTDQVAGFANFPQSTTDYGFLAGSSHIDQKTNRVIGPEQRLFLWFGSKALPIQSTFAGPDSSIVGYSDWRLLGNLQRSTNRRNAAR